MCGRHQHSILLGHNSYNQLVSWKLPFLWFNSIFCYPFLFPSLHFVLSVALKIFNLTSSHPTNAGDVAQKFHCGSLKTEVSFHFRQDFTFYRRRIPHIMLNMVYFTTLSVDRVMFSGSLSPQHSAFSGCE